MMLQGHENVAELYRRHRGAVIIHEGPFTYTLTKRAVAHFHAAVKVARELGVDLDNSPLVDRAICFELTACEVQHVEPEPLR